MEVELDVPRGGGCHRRRRRDATGHRPDGRTSHGVHADPAQPGRRVRLPGLRLARPRSRATGTRPSSARTAPRRWPRRRPASCSTASSSPPTPSRTSPAVRSSGSASRAASPSRWCCDPAPPTTSRSRGTTRSPRSPTTSTASTTPTRRRSTPPGKTSNEAAFAYQLFARSLGTNNLPDCSNMCHESSGSALVDTIGIGKGSVSLEDIHQAKLLLVVGQNPGTNHPRMLSALEEAKSRGAKIIAINPLQEAGLVRFKNPQNAKGLTVGTGDGRPPPADPAQRRPGVLPGRGIAAGRVGRARPRLPRRGTRPASTSTSPTWRTSTGPRSRRRPA